MATPFRQTDPEPALERTPLTSVPDLAERPGTDEASEAASKPPPDGPLDPDPEGAFEDGLVTVTVIGGAVGFAIVFALTAVALYVIADAGLPAALAGACFVGAFAGLGAGAMMAASLHNPKPPRAAAG